MASTGQKNLEELKKAASSAWGQSKINGQDRAPLNHAKEYAIESGGQETHFTV